MYEGAAGLRALSLRLKAAGEVELKRSMGRNIRAATLPLKAAIPASARATLPKSGGLNEWVASAKVGTSILTGPKTAGVVIRVRKAGHDMKDIDAGKVRHPVRGNRKKWVSQSVQPGFASRPFADTRPAVIAACVVAMRETAAAAGFEAV